MHIQIQKYSDTHTNCLNSSPFVARRVLQIEQKQRQPAADLSGTVSRFSKTEKQGRSLKWFHQSLHNFWIDNSNDHIWKRLVNDVSSVFINILECFGLNILWCMPVYLEGSYKEVYCISEDHIRGVLCPAGPAQTQTYPRQIIRSLMQTKIEVLGKVSHKRRPLIFSKSWIFKIVNLQNCEFAILQGDSVKEDRSCQT